MKKSTVLVVAALLCGLAAWLFFPKTVTLESTVNERLSAELGRSATFEPTRQTADRDFKYLCGKPLEVDGSPFDYQAAGSNQEYATSTSDDSFCALIKGDEIVEFDLGSTDMPVFDWIEKYELDEDAVFNQQ